MNCLGRVRDTIYMESWGEKEISLPTGWEYGQLGPCWELLLSFHHQPSPTGCIWALVGAEIVNACIQPGLEPPVLVPARVRSKNRRVYALGMFRGRAAHALLHPLRQQDVSGVASSVPSQGTSVPRAQSQVQHGPG